MRFLWIALCLTVCFLDLSETTEVRVMITLTGNSSQDEVLVFTEKVLNNTEGISISDVNECESISLNTCHMNATCSNTNGGFECACNVGYQDSNPTDSPGKICDDVDECANVSACTANASCINIPGSYQCACKDGYQSVTGDGPTLTCTDVDECRSKSLNTCHVNATCSNTNGGFECACNVGYEDNSPTDSPGTICDDIDECVNVTACNANATCINIPGSHQCACKAGYQKPAGDGPTLTCIDIDECLNTSLCDELAVCQNTLGSFSCICNTGFTGTGEFCSDIDECAANTDNCSTDAVCANVDGGFNCTCREGFSGDGYKCEATEICGKEPSPCPDHSTCMQNNGLHSCLCHYGYHLVLENQLFACVELVDTSTIAQTTLSTGNPSTAGDTTLAPESTTSTATTFQPSTTAKTTTIITTVRTTQMKTDSTSTAESTTSPTPTTSGLTSHATTTMERNTDQELVDTSTIAQTTFSTENPSTVGNTTESNEHTTNVSEAGSKIRSATFANGADTTVSTISPTLPTTRGQTSHATTTTTMERTTEQSTSATVPTEMTSPTKIPDSPSTPRALTETTTITTTKTTAKPTTLATTVATTATSTTAEISTVAATTMANKTDNLTPNIAETTGTVESNQTPSTIGRSTLPSSTTSAPRSTTRGSDTTVISTSKPQETTLETTTTTTPTIPVTTKEPDRSTVATSTPKAGEVTTKYVSPIRILQGNITAEAANEFAANITGGGKPLRSGDVENLATSLTNVLNAGINITKETAGNLLDVVGKFQIDVGAGADDEPGGADVEDVAQVPAEQAAKLTQFVSNLLESMVIPVGEEFEKTTDTLAIKAVNVRREDALKEGSDFELGGKPLFFMPPKFIESAKATNTSKPETASEQIAYVYYSDALLFPERGVSMLRANDTRRRYLKGYVVVSPILGGSIAGKTVRDSDAKAEIRVQRYELNDTQEPLGNGTFAEIEYGNATCVWWNYNTSRWTKEGCQTQNADDPDNTTCTCDHLTNFAVLMTARVAYKDPVLDMLSLIGCALSIIGLLWTILTYSLFKSLRKHKSKKILLHFCVALCCVYITYLTGLALKLPNNEIQCLVSGFFMHYFTLAVIAWMFVEVLDMYLMFVKLFTTFHKYMLKVAMLGWGFPCLIAASTLGAHFGLQDKEWYVAENRLYPEYEGSRTVCWLGVAGMTYAFIIPSCLILIVNLILFTVVLYHITCKRNNARLSRIRSTNKPVGARQHILNAAALLLLAGPTWIFGYFINIDPVKDGALRRTFSYIFVIFNVFQGLWIFIVFSIRPEPVRRMWHDLLVKRKIVDLSHSSNSRSWQHGTGRHTISTVATKSPRPSLVPPSTACSSTKSTLVVHSPPVKRTVASRISNSSSNSEQSKSSTRSSSALLVSQNRDRGPMSLEVKSQPRRKLPEIRLPSAIATAHEIKEESSYDSSLENTESDRTESPSSMKSCDSNKSGEGR